MKYDQKFIKLKELETICLNNDKNQYLSKNY